MRYKNLFDVKKYAENLGIRCLSSKFINMNEAMQWQCSHNHIWVASMDEILKGKSCDECNKEILNEKFLKSLQIYAVKKKGKCLSFQYIDEKTPLEWKCRKSHIWYAPPYEIRKNTWCPICNQIKHINDIQKKVNKFGIKCISEEYIDENTPLEWKCNKGHIWHSCPQEILKQQCPICLKIRNTPLDDFQIIAQAKGGKCLSENFATGIKKMYWECAFGDTWYTTAKNIQKGKWCPVCHFLESLTILYLCNYCKKWTVGDCKNTNFICNQCHKPILLNDIIHFEFVQNHRLAISLGKIKNKEKAIPNDYVSGFQILIVNEIYYFEQIIKKLNQLIFLEQKKPVTIEYILRIYLLYLQDYNLSLKSYGSFIRFMRFALNTTQGRDTIWKIIFREKFLIEIKNLK